jgi:hypothetical protein
MRICNYKSIRNMKSSKSRIQSRVRSSLEYNNERRYKKKWFIWKSIARITSIISSLIFSRLIAHELQTSVITEQIKKRLLFSRCCSLRSLENFARIWISILRTSSRLVISTASISRLFRIRINHLRHHLRRYSNRVMIIESKTSVFVRNHIYKKATRILFWKLVLLNKSQIRKNEIKFVRKFNHSAHNYIDQSNIYAIRTSWKNYSFSTSFIDLRKRIEIEIEDNTEIENNQEMTNYSEKMNKANKIKKIINRSNYQLQISLSKMLLMLLKIWSFLLISIRTKIYFATASLMTSKHSIISLKIEVDL